LCATLLAGCYDGRAYPDIEVNTSIFKVLHQDQLTLLAADRFETANGSSVAIVTNPPKVYWVDTTCPYLDDAPTAVVIEGRCYFGLMYDCGEIYVAVKTTLSDSALVHELMHCFLMRAGITADAAHNNIIAWQLVHAINDEANERGW